MKSIEQPVAEPEKHEKEPTYNFKEIAEIEPAMISLVEKLKDKIESGEYDTLISDEVGGRIPTLILRSIIKEKNKEQKKQAPKTYYVVGGMTPVNRGAIRKFVRKISPQVKKALLVTEYSSSGDSMSVFSRIMEEGGLENFDIAVVYMDSESSLDIRAEADGKLDSNFFAFENDHYVYSGQFSRNQSPSLYWQSSKFAGVEKMIANNKVVGVHPFRLEDVKRNYLEEVSAEDLGQIPEDVTKAREDVKTMSEKVLSKVWGSRQTYFL